MTYRKQVFLAVLLMASSALAQTKGSSAGAVAEARCAYMRCASAAENHDGKWGGDQTLAQMQRRSRAPMGRPPMRGASYPQQWVSGPSPAHALIGALIGFGFGAAIAAKGHNDAGNVLAFGALGAGIGAGIGLSIPAFPHRYRYRPYYPEDDEASRSRRRDARELARRGARQTAPAGVPGS